MRRILFVLFVTVLLAVPVLGADATTQTAQAANTCKAGGDPGAPKIGAITRDTGMQSMFTAYGNNNSLLDDWTGADGNFSVRLPDGRDVWMFSDTYLGRVDNGHSRPFDTRLINNSFVLQQGTSLVRTLHGGTAANPASLMAPTDGSSWYWVSDGTVEGNSLRVFLPKYLRTGPGMWDWHWTGTDVATYSLPGMTLTGYTAAPSSNGVTYGAAILEDKKFTYVYGVEDLSSVKYLHVARTTAGSVLGPYQFLNGSSKWSASPAASTRQISGIGNGFSVTKINGRYVLITMDSSFPFSNEIVAYSSCKPWGPFTHRTHVYSAPESMGNLFVYNAHAHPQFGSAGGLLVSYDENSFNGPDTYADVNIYRPKYIRVPISF
jgi:hypothetical protein